MNHKSYYRALTVVCSLCLGILAFDLRAQGTAFTYQGQLNSNGVPVTASYDFTFTLYTAATGGSVVSIPQTNFSVPVVNGLFTTNLDFGPVFNGSNYWLSIGVCTNSGTNFTTLSPRQPLLPVPYAVFATTASNLLGTVYATQLAGALPSAQISGTYTGAVTFTNAADTFVGNFSGNGTNLTNLNASAISSGTLADARLSGNVPLLNANNLFSGANSFTNRNNAFTGSFFGNGLVGWIPVLGTTTQAVPNTAYILLNTNPVTVTLPTNTVLFTGDVVRVAGPYAGGWQIAQNPGQSVLGIFLNPTNASWLPAAASSVSWHGIASSADGSKMAAVSVSAGGIFVSTDYGKTWSVSQNSASDTSISSSADGTHLVAAGYGGVVSESTNSGSTWFNLTSSSSTLNWSGLTCSADGSKFASCIYGSGIFIWNNFGVSSNFYSGAANWTCIAGSSDCSRLAACITNGGIYTSINSGTSFSQSAFPSAGWTCIASSADGLKLAAGTSNGHIYTSVDGGASYTLQAGSPSTNWTAITSSYDGSRLAATTRTGGIYVSGNFGLTWEKQAVVSQSWYGIAASQDLGVMAAVSFDNINGGKISYWSPSVTVTSSSVGTTGSLTGSPGSSVELLYIGNNQFMPISSSGTFWAN